MRVDGVIELERRAEVDRAGLAAALGDSLYLMKARGRGRERCAWISTDRPSCLLDHMIFVDGLYFGFHVRRIP